MSDAPSRPGKTPTRYALTHEMVADKFPVEHEPPIDTMSRPLVIESACPGFQKGGARYPAIPISLEDQIQAQVDSIKAGAIIVHVHPRDPKTGEAQMNHRLLAEVLDGIFAGAGDCVTYSHSWTAVPNAPGEGISGTAELLELGGGNKYCQGSLLVPIGHSTTGSGKPSLVTEQATIEAIAWMNAHDVKPVYQLFDTYTHLDFKRRVFDRGLDSSRPYAMNIQLGKHDATATNLDPWSHLQIITSMQGVRQTIPDCLIGIYPGGRNWLPMATMGILLGADVIRVGIEDCYWMYPHRSEIIESHAEVVRMFVDLARKLGRRVVTDASEARSILGIRLTSSPLAASASPELVSSV
jgi:3-keto-5-aminohexanoate cleavage enzyme